MQLNVYRKASISYCAEFPHALPKPTCVTEQSPGRCQVCWCTDLTSLLSCLSRQGSKRADSSGPHVGSSLAVWPPVCRLARITSSPSFLVKLGCAWRILFERCVVSSETFKKFPIVGSFEFACSFDSLSFVTEGPRQKKEMSNLKYYMSKFVQSKLSITQLSLVMRLSFIWGKEQCSSFLLCFPFSLYFSFITMHVSSHVSLSSLCTFLSAFGSLPWVLYSCSPFCPLALPYAVFVVFIKIPWFKWVS